LITREKKKTGEAVEKSEIWPRAAATARAAAAHLPPPPPSHHVFLWPQ